VDRVGIGVVDIDMLDHHSSSGWGMRSQALDAPSGSGLAFETVSGL
jgi:hypothetical protein